MTEWMVLHRLYATSEIQELSDYKAYIINIKNDISMTILETILYIIGWSTMIGIFNYLENEWRINDQEKIAFSHLAFCL